MITKKLIIGAMMIIIGAPAMAQSQPDEIMTKVSALIKSNTDDAKDQIEDIAKENKKNALALVSIAKAYLAANDKANAKEYANKALELVNKKGTAEEKGATFVLLGNIAVAEDDGGAAAQWFQQAIYGDPQNPDGYRRYAQIMSKTDPNGAVQTLEDLRKHRPDYPVDLIAAEIYSSSGKMKQANEYYSKVSLDKMKDYQVSDYSTNLFLSQDYAKSLEVANYGHQKWPRNASMNRLIMFNETSNKNYDAAIAAGNNLFNASDSAKITAYDYNYYATALKGAQKYEEAIKSYEKIQQLEDIDAATVAEKNKDISDCYKKLSNYNKAGEYLDKYLKAQTQSSFSLDETLATLFADELMDDKTTPERKKEAYAKADEIYAQLAEKYPTNAAYIASKRAKLPFALEATDMEKLKMAGPHYLTLANILEASKDRSEGETKLLINAYSAVCAYYVHCMDDMETAKQHAQKLLQLDSENASAKAIVGTGE
ncbi:MAG: hypothetical protein J6B33_01705 [Prevotella sp.]|nr:hypothetical protein [Prevotella sp.]